MSKERLEPMPMEGEVKLPKHTCSLYLEHNAHLNVYQTAESYIEEMSGHYSWKDEESKNKAIQVDEIWTLRWHSDTPKGFIAIAAPTLEELLELANEEEDLKTAYKND